MPLYESGFFKLRQHAFGLCPAAVELALDLVQSVVDVDPARLVKPAVFKGDAEPVQHDGVDELCIAGELVELRHIGKLPGQAEEAGHAYGVAGIVDVGKNHLIPPK